MVLGTVVAINQSYTPTSEFAGITAYTAIWALGLNFIVAGVLTLVMRALGQTDTADETSPDDYDELTETGRPPPLADAPVG
jgi:hypothetical protein